MLIRSAARDGEGEVAGKANLPNIETPELSRYRYYDPHTYEGSDRGTRTPPPLMMP